MTTYAKIERILVEEMGIDHLDVSPSTSFRELGLDSLEMAQLALELEDEFGIDIPEDDMQNIFTVRDAIKYAEKRLAA